MIPLPMLSSRSPTADLNYSEAAAQGNDKDHRETTEDQQEHAELRVWPLLPTQTTEDATLGLLWLSRLLHPVWRQWPLAHHSLAAEYNHVLHHMKPTILQKC